MAELVLGRPTLISIDFQNCGYNQDYSIPQMPGFAKTVARASSVLAAARATGIPVIFIQERHSRTRRRLRPRTRRLRRCALCGGRV